MHEPNEALEVTLLSQATSLRALARGLLGDDHAAQDVVQDTWLASLRSAPRALGGGWLHGVAGHLAKNRKRADRSRTHHEARAARPEATLATDVKAAEREVVRMVIDAVSELEDPYKSVILMRYYQDLAPRFIAQERGAPVATIKSQLHRGLARLRERLDELSGGERERWAVALSGSLTAPGAGVLSASKLVVAGLVLLAGSAAYMGQDALSSQRLPDVGTQVVAAVAGTESTSSKESARDDFVLGSGEQDNQRVALVGDAPLADAAGSAPYAFEMELDVRNGMDVPVEGAGVFLFPAQHPINVVGTTNEHGKLVVRWRGFEDSMQMVLGLQKDGLLRGAFRRVTCRAGEHPVLRLTTEQAPDLSASKKVTAEIGIPGPGQWGRIKASAARRQLPSGTDIHEAARDEISGEIHFVWFPEIMDHNEEPVVMDLEDESWGLGSLGYAGDMESAEASTGSANSPTMWHVKGVVSAPDGRPAPHAMLLARGKFPTLYSRANADGAFDMQVPPTASLELRAGGGDQGLAWHEVHQDLENASATVVWNPILKRGNEANGRLLLETLEAADLYCVEAELETDGGLYCDLGRATAGTFSIPNLPAAGGRLILSHAASWPFASAVLDARAPSAVDEEFDRREASSAGVAFHVLSAASERAASRMEVRLWQLSSGRGVLLPHDGQRGLHAREALLPGLYQLSVGNADLGYRDLGTQLVESEDVQVGPVVPVEPASIQLTVNGAAPQRDSGWTWTLQRRVHGVDSSFGFDPFASGGSFEIPAGEYRLSLSSADVLLPLAPLVVVAGQAIELDVNLESLGELVVRGAGGAESADAEYRVLDAAGVLELRRAELQAGAAERLNLQAGSYILERGGQREPFVIVAGEQLVL